MPLVNRIDSRNSVIRVDLDRFQDAVIRVKPPWGLQLRAGHPRAWGLQYGDVSLCHSNAVWWALSPLFYRL